MRVVLLPGLIFLLLAALLSDTDAPSDHCTVRLELVDAGTGNSVSGLVQIRDEAGNLIKPAELLDRGLGLEDQAAIQRWSVLIEPTTVHLPRAKLRLSAFSGLETEQAEMTLDLSNRAEATVRIPLTRFYPARERGYQAGNTHVHLKKTSRAESDRYLRQTAWGDGLDVVFVSYLERAGDDVHYSTNKYSRQELQQLSNRHTHFDHGEEHRHNFNSYGQGYGHVMLLAIPELIHPVSIGPAISGQGTDGRPLADNLRRAEQLGASIIWCHNDWGLEDIPNWLAGLLDANNIFDGGTHGSYRHSFYRYLNAGLKVPFSTGTDWFIYDFSRVYIPASERLTPEAWLEQLSAGRGYITNGPLLEFDVAGRASGDTIALSGPEKLKITGRAAGRLDFQRLELVRNGQVVHTAASRAEGGHFLADLNWELDVAEPCWLALRTPPPSSDRDEQFQQPTPRNEYGAELFSHTSAVYVEVAGRKIFDPFAARALLAEMTESREFILRRALFVDDHERQHVLAVYDEGIRELTRRLEEHASK